jgi:hypothetical protein
MVKVPDSTAMSFHPKESCRKFFLTSLRLPVFGLIPAAPPKNLTQRRKDAKTQAKPFEMTIPYQFIKSMATPRCRRQPLTIDASACLRFFASLRLCAFAFKAANLSILTQRRKDAETQRGDLIANFQFSIFSSQFLSLRYRFNSANNPTLASNV